jgi:hypothetical protein
MEEIIKEKDDAVWIPYEEVKVFIGQVVVSLESLAGHLSNTLELLEENVNKGDDNVDED